MRLPARNWFLPFAILLPAVLLAPASAFADRAEFAEKIEGEYESTEPLDQVRDRLDAQVEKSVERMAFYKRPFARPRLQDAVKPCKQVTFRFPEEGRFEVQCDDDPPSIAAWDGTETEYEGEEGDVYDLSQTVESDRIVQVFESENGSRTNVYRLQGDTVVMKATLRSEMLPEPITFQRKFTRK